MIALRARSHRFRSRVVSVVLGLLGSVAIACDSTPLLAPTQSTIIIVADRLIVPVNGEATITATVTEQGGTAVHNGTLVSFSTSLGLIEPSEARTNNGKVTVKLRAGPESGTAVISAFSGSAAATGENAVSVQIGAAAAGAIVLSVSPATVPSTGGTVNVTAAVNDTNGNRITGVPVSLSADIGTLGSTSVVTDANGEAKTTLTTDRQTIVSASVGALAPVTFTVAANTAPTATVSVTTASPVVGQATIFSLTVTAGSSTITGVTFNFGDGQSQPLGVTAGASTVSHVYAVAGTYTATLTVTDAGGEQVSGSAVIFVTAAPPINVNLSASPSPATEDEVVTFTATASGSTVPISSYAWSFGDGTAFSTSGSIVTHVYTDPATVAVGVTATNTDNVTGSTQITLVVAPLQVNVVINAAPQSPALNQVVTFTATVTPSTAIVTNYDWFFGDTPETVLRNGGRTTTKSYAAAGDKVVRVEVTLVDGSIESSQTVVTVRP